MNQSEFLQIVMPFKDKLFRLAKRLLISEQEAEDATQEVLLKLWTKKKAMKNYRNVEAFSMTMIKNYCFDRLKSKQAQTTKLIDNTFSKQTSLEKNLEIKDSVDWVSRIIETLPDNQRLIIQLRDIEQLSLEEIVEITKMTPVNVRVTLSRARKTIKEQLLKTHDYGIK